MTITLVKVGNHLQSETAVAAVLVGTETLTKQTKTLQTLAMAAGT